LPPSATEFVKLACGIRKNLPRKTVVLLYTSILTSKAAEQGLAEYNSK